MNIIIVDDDKLVSLSLKTILEASGEVNVCAITRNWTLEQWKDKLKSKRREYN